MAQQIETVAVMSPGDMGHAVAAVLRANGLRVITCLAGRSARTRALAAEAGAIDVGSDAALLAEADLLLSILVPAQALAWPNASLARCSRARGRRSTSTATRSRPRPRAVPRR